MKKKQPVHRRPSVLAAAAAALATVTVTFVLTLGGGGNRFEVRVELGGPHGTPTTTATVPAPLARQVAASELGHHDDLRTENPAGVPAAELDAAREQQEKLAASDQLPIVTPDAAPEQRGCVTRLVQDYSSRRGVRPRLFVLHYTVSPNRPGWADVYAVARLFDTPAFQASSNYIVDADGHCLYIVRESDKAWTQAAANPVAISVEVINTGHEATYAGTAGAAKVALLIHDAAHRWHFPIQPGAVRGCVVTRPGVVDHGMLGACGGGHHDIAPYRIKPLIRAARALDGGSRPAAPDRIRRLPACPGTALQRALNRHGAHLAVDGQVGRATRAAIRRFQRNHRLRPTGHIGRPAARALGLRACRA